MFKAMMKNDMHKSITIQWTLCNWNRCVETKSIPRKDFLIKNMSLNFRNLCVKLFVATNI